jgi:preprotein translocase subunit YajC
VLYAASGSGGGSSLAPVLMMVLLFGAMYFLFIRPNQRRRQKVAEMQRSIGPGDEILTIGGLYGVVQEIDDDRVVLEVAPGVLNQYSRGAISSVVTAADQPELDDDEDNDDEVESMDVSLKKVVDTD